MNYVFRVTSVFTNISTFFPSRGERSPRKGLGEIRRGGLPHEFAKVQDSQAHALHLRGLANTKLGKSSNTQSFFRVL